MLLATLLTQASLAFCPRVALTLQCRTPAGICPKFMHPQARRPWPWGTAPTDNCSLSVPGSTV